MRARPRDEAYLRDNFDGFPVRVRFVAIAHALATRFLVGVDRRDTLALTKMNWNTTQFDGRLPIPITAARSVGRVLRYVAFGRAFFGLQALHLI
jgi:hypothetical protein